MSLVRFFFGSSLLFEFSSQCSISGQIFHLVLQVLERIIPEAYKNPTKAWELLNGETSVFHTERARLMCRVCRIALDCGLAKKVSGLI